MFAPSAAIAAECTNTWIGPTGGTWQTAEYWSTEVIPTSVDVVCVPAEKTVRIESGSQSAEVLQGGGTVRLLGGSLAISGTSSASNIGTLRFDGGARKGAAELHVTESLIGNGGSLEGVGSTFIGAEATAVVNDTGEGNPPGLRVANTHELVIRGELSLHGPAGGLALLTGARLENSGTIELVGSESELSGNAGHIENKGAGALEVDGGKAAIRLDGGALDNLGSLRLAGSESRLATQGGAQPYNSGSIELVGAASAVRLIGDRIDIPSMGSLEASGVDSEIRLEGGRINSEGVVDLTGSGSRVWADEGARIDNDGFLRIYAEGASRGLAIGSTGSHPILHNTGVFKKSEGTGTSYVDFEINNEGAFRAEVGTLAARGGGSSGKEEKIWLADGEARLRFVEGAYYLGETVAIAGDVTIEKEAIVSADSYAAAGSWIQNEEGILNILGAEGVSQFGRLDLLGTTLVVPANSSAGASFLGLAEGGLTLGTEAKWSGGYIAQVGGAIEAKARSLLSPEYVEQVEGSIDVKGEATLAVGYVDKRDGQVEIQPDASLQVSSGWKQQGGSLVVHTGARFLGEPWFWELAGGTQTFGGDVASRFYFFGQKDGEVSASKFSAQVMSRSGGAATMTAGSESSIGTLEQGAGTLSFGGGSTIESTGFLGVYGGELEVADDSDVTGGIVGVYGGQLDLGGDAELQLNSALVVGGGALTGAGSTDSRFLALSGGSLEGSGQSLAREGTFISPGAEEPTLAGRTLVTLGEVSFEAGTLAMGSGARWRNSAEVQANSETTAEGGQIRTLPGGAEPEIVNRGAFEKTAGEGTTTIDVAFSNFGAVGQRSGQLRFTRALNLPASDRFGLRCHCGDPIESATGNFTESQTDIAVGGLGVGLVLQRSYSAQAAADEEEPGSFGYGWTTSFSDRLIAGEEGAITVRRGDGSTVPFTATGEGFAGPEWSEATLIGDPETGYEFKDRDQIELSFSPAGRLMRVADRSGNETTLSYDEVGRLAAIVDPAEREIVLSYDEAGFVESAEDPMGHLVTYAYEGDDLASVTLPGEAEPRWRFEYDEDHRMTALIDGRGGNTANEYDVSNRVIHQTDPEERSLSLEYESFHTRITNDGTGSVTDQWFTTYNQPFEVTRGVGTEAATTESFVYDDEGRLVGETDGNEHTTTYGYNGAGDRVSEIDPNENETEWAYNATHDVISVIKPGGELTTIARDGAGNPESISSPAPGEVAQTTSFEYDGQGQLERVTDPLERRWSYSYNPHGDRIGSIDPEGNLTSWQFNGNSQLIGIVTPRGNAEGAEPADFTTALELDPQGRIEEALDPLGNSTKYSYDGNGNVESETDAKGKTTNFTYNGADELIEVEKPNGAITKSEFDGAGMLVAQIDGNEEATTYIRDAVGNPVEIIDPLERKTVQEFDGVGNLVASVDPAERTTTYVYDPDNRLTEVDYSEEATPDQSFEYDVDDNLVEVHDGSGTSRYDYDQLGRLEEVTNGHGDSVSYAYNLADEVEEIGYPNGKEVAQGFDEVGRLATVTDWLGGTTTFSYDRDSNLREISFPGETQNVDEFTHDPNGAILSAAMRKAGTPIASLGYERDTLGFVESESRSGFLGSGAISYDYDENGRLTEAGAETFDYDNADNLIEASGSSFTYDKASQLEAGTGASYEYSALGQRLRSTPVIDPESSYSYDQAGNLVSVQRSAEGEVSAIDESFAYDAQGLMSARTAGEATDHLTWSPVGSLPLLLSDEDFTYIYGPGGQPIEQISEEEEPTYLHHDQLGSTRLLTDEAGEAVAAFNYGAYGSLTESSGEAETRMGFAGQYTLEQSGLQYLRARVYDPATGQFLSRDPLEEVTREPYSYASNNPANRGDPAGLFSLAGVGGAILDAGGFIKDTATGVASDLNPVRYYQEEIRCIEEGCSYLESVSHGLQGAAVLACDVTGVGALGRGLLGRGGASLTGDSLLGGVAEESGVIFGHGARHLAGTGLGQLEVETAIRAQVLRSTAGASSSGTFWGTVVVNGQKLPIVPTRFQVAKLRSEPTLLLDSANG